MDERNATNHARAGRAPAARARLLTRPPPLPNPAQVSHILNLTPGRNKLRHEAFARSTFVQPIAGRDPTPTTGQMLPNRRHALQDVTSDCRIFCGPRPYPRPALRHCHSESMRPAVAGCVWVWSSVAQGAPARRESARQKQRLAALGGFLMIVSACLVSEISNLKSAILGPSPPRIVSETSARTTP
jgi:hypothetical protein